MNITMPCSFVLVSASISFSSLASASENFDFEIVRELYHGPRVQMNLRGEDGSQMNCREAPSKSAPVKYVFTRSVGTAMFSSAFLDAFDTDGHRTVPLENLYAYDATGLLWLKVSYSWARRDSEGDYESDSCWTRGNPRYWLVTNSVG